jgi:hypothetical protein
MGLQAAVAEVAPPVQMVREEMAVLIILIVPVAAVGLMEGLRP